jgi:Uma2 family endonuclease
MNETSYTVEDLWKISHQPANKNKRFELLEGKLIEMPLNSWQQSSIIGKLALLIGNFVYSRKLGSLTAANTGYILKRGDKDFVVTPAIGFVDASRVPIQLLDDSYVPFAPDFAVYFSPVKTTTIEEHEKWKYYILYGTKLLWMLIPRYKRVMVCDLFHNKPGAIQTSYREINDTLDGGDVLPGFGVKVKDIFGK